MTYLSYRLLWVCVGQVWLATAVLGAAALGARAVLRRALRALRRQPAPRPLPYRPPGVHRVPGWAARTPESLRQHPDLADIDQQLDQRHAEIADYYPAASNTPKETT